MTVDPSKRHLIVIPNDFIVSDESIAIVVYPIDHMVTPPVASLITEKGMCLDDFFYWATRMSDAVDWVHQNSVLHGNIRPESFILTPDRQNLRLGDFSCAMQW